LVIRLPVSLRRLRLRGRCAGALQRVPAAAPPARAAARGDRERRVRRRRAVSRCHHDQIGSSSPTRAC